jgi:hypothetical protein
MPSLLLYAHQPGSGQAREVAAGGLRRDARDVRQLRCRQRSPVHQGVQHSGTGWFSRHQRHFGKSRAVRHENLR